MSGVDNSERKREEPIGTEGSLEDGSSRVEHDEPDRPPRTDSSFPRRAYDFYRRAGFRPLLRAGVGLTVEAIPFSDPVLSRVHDRLHHRRNDGHNPVFTADEVTDYGDATFVADPFFLAEDDAWHLFFEVFNDDRDPDAVIGHAMSTDRGASWEYTQVVLNPGHHVSFPYVFEHGGDYHMLVEAGGRGSTERSIDRYVATTFPGEWYHAQRLVTVDRSGGDTVLFQWDDRWWLAGGDSESGLRLYYSDDLESDAWTPHEANPVVDRGKRATRPAGRPVVRDDRILFFFQDCVRVYGAAVRAYEITELTPSRYKDRPLSADPVLGGTGRFGWRSGRMHHVDPQYVDGEWHVIADGDSAGSALFGSRWSIGHLEGFDTPILPGNGGA